MVEARSIFLEGFFDDHDWTALLALLRVLEARHPNSDFRCFVCEGASTMSVAEIMQEVHEAGPTVGRKITKIIKRSGGSA